MATAIKKVPQYDLYNVSFPKEKTPLRGAVLDCKPKTDISKVGGCPRGSWTYPQNASCSTVTDQLGNGQGLTKICVQPNPNLCPNFSGKNPPKFVSPLEQGGWSGRSDSGFNCGLDPKNPLNKGGTCYANLECSYDIGKFNTADVQGWLSKWGADDNYNTVIMPHFCEQQVSTCPIDPATNQPMPACSRMVSTWDDGKLCKNWMSANKDLGKTTVIQYCELYNTPDCGCINRDQSADYVKTKTGIIDGLGMKMEDTCWYIPCSYPYQTGNYLIPPTWTEPKCPNVCEQVVKLVNEGKITGGIPFKQSINCDWGDGGGNGPKQSYFQAHKMQIIIWSLVFVILLILVSVLVIVFY